MDSFKLRAFKVLKISLQHTSQAVIFKIRLGGQGGKDGSTILELWFDQFNKACLYIIPVNMNKVEFAGSGRDSKLV